MATSVVEWQKLLIVCCHYIEKKILVYPNVTIFGLLCPPFFLYLVSKSGQPPHVTPEFLWFSVVFLKYIHKKWFVLLKKLIIS